MMQSEPHQQQQPQQQQLSEGPKKNPYLVGYKNDISAKQRELRQKLAATSLNATTANLSNRQSLSRDTIPSIDDETLDALVVPRPPKHDQKDDSRADDSAEESLRFFKRNLLQPAASTRTPTGGLFDRQPSLVSSSQNMVDPYSLSQVTKTEPNQLSDTRLPETRPTKPVPFKQTAINQTLARKRLPVIEPNDTTFSSQQNRSAIDPPQPRHLSEQRERPTNEESGGRQRASSDRRSGTRPRSLERLSPEEVKPPRPSRHQKNIPEPEESQPITPPPPNEPFSRKPLYNSLLRTQDSIRLKVNRPKVRPKSEVLNPDTEVVDFIPLTPIVTNEVNERAVDVKRSSSRKKGKKNDEEKKVVRNFSEVRNVKIVRTENERSIGVTVKVEDGNIVVARIMAGSLADKQGALQVRDIILSVNNREVYTPEQLQELLKETIHEDTVVMKIVPSFREELPTLCIYLRALFAYDANEDSLLPCKEIGVSFNQGDILEVVNQEDPNWWQARRVDSDNLQTGLIPSQELEERRRAFVIPDYDLATRTSICGSKVTKKSKKKEIYNLGQNCDFDRAELQLYEEVCRTPAFERRTLVLIGANGVGRQALKARLVSVDPERFGTPLPHTSRLPREGEEDGVHYHFVTREKMEEEIIDGKYLEYGEYEGALYGTKLDSVREIIGDGKVCVLDCSATCLKILKTSDYLPFVAFIAAPTLDQLRYMHEYARTGNRNYTTFDRALSRQSRRARTLQDFAFDFFEDEDLQLTVEESARLFRMYENYFDIVLVNNNLDETFELLKDAINALSMAPQWIPISWIYGT